jgi:glycine cleavage system regulatory protein
MQVPLVMSIIGRDRPGLVEMVARIVAKHGGNWLESRMCRLGGEFAGILRVELAEEHRVALEEELTTLKGQGLTIMVVPAASDRGATERGKCAALELVGQDRPGIVRDISGALARQGVNVEELVTEYSSAPMSGEALFKARAHLRLPESCSLPQLRRELERIAGNLLVDVAIKEVSQEAS